MHVSVSTDTKSITIVHEMAVMVENKVAGVFTTHGVHYQLGRSDNHNTITATYCRCDMRTSYGKRQQMKLMTTTVLDFDDRNTSK